MTELAEWETEGAKARPATPEDRNRPPAPVALLLRLVAGSLVRR